MLAYNVPVLGTVQNTIIYSNNKIYFALC